MADDLNMKIDDAAAAKFQAAIMALQSELHRSPKAAVKFATNKFLRSIAARTKVAKPFPKVIPITRHKKKYWRIINDLPYDTERSHWKWLKKTNKKKQVQEYNKRRYAGLAKRMWFIASRRAGTSGVSSPRVRWKKDVNAMNVVKNLQGYNPFIKVEDRLAYAEDALTSNNALNESFVAAADSMMGYINKMLAKKIK